MSDSFSMYTVLVKLVRTGGTLLWNVHVHKADYKSVQYTSCCFRHSLRWWARNCSRFEKYFRMAALQQDYYNKVFMKMHFALHLFFQVNRISRNIASSQFNEIVTKGVKNSPLYNWNCLEVRTSLVIHKWRQGWRPVEPYGLERQGFSLHLFRMLHTNHPCAVKIGVSLKMGILFHIHRLPSFSRTGPGVMGSVGLRDRNLLALVF